MSLKRRDLIILLVFWLTAACTIGIMVFFFFLRPSGSTAPVYEVASGEATALTLYPVAEQAARDWEEDTQFVSASASWNEATIADFEQSTEWVYRFYSPGQQRLLFVIVTPDKTVITRSHLRKTRRELRIINPEAWTVDSNQAITDWLNSGGGTWVQQASNRIVSIQLVFDDQVDSPIWIISALNPDTGQSATYEIRA